MAPHLIEVLQGEPRRIDEVVAARAERRLHVLIEAIARGEARRDGRQAGGIETPAGGGGMSWQRMTLRM